MEKVYLKKINQKTWEVFATIAKSSQPTDKKEKPAKSKPVDTTKELAEKVGISARTAGKIIKITESKDITDEQKEKLRTGDLSIDKQVSKCTYNI